eukprot:ANDGO_00285.mRNA.1 Transcription elongation factor S-II
MPSNSEQRMKRELDTGDLVDETATKKIRLGDSELPDSSSFVKHIEDCRLFMKLAEPASTDVQTVLDVLDQLSKIKVDRDLLRESKGGRVMKSLSKSSSGVVAAKASALLLDWMKECGVSESKDEPPTNSAADGGEKAKTETKAAPKKSKTGSMTFEEKKQLDTTSERNLRTILGDYFLEGHLQRNTYRAELFKALDQPAIFDSVIEGDLKASSSSADTDQLSAECLQHACAIEDAMYKSLGSDSRQYQAKFMSLRKNIARNPELRIRIQTMDLLPSELINLHPSELAHDEMRKQYDKLKQKNLHKALAGEGNNGTVTDMFVCSRCKNKKCSYTQKQTRSADEPMTTFVCCMVCFNRWKFC